MWKLAPPYTLSGLPHNPGLIGDKCLYHNNMGDHKVVDLWLKGQTITFQTLHNMFNLGYGASFFHWDWAKDLLYGLDTFEEIEIWVPKMQNWILSYFIHVPLMTLFLWISLLTNEGILSLPQMKMWVTFHAFSIFNFNFIFYTCKNLQLIWIVSNLVEILVKASVYVFLLMFFFTLEFAVLQFRKFTHM